CVMARQCHLNTCPVGIATQDEKLRTRFTGRPEMVMAYFRGVAAEVRELLARLGASSLDEIVGHTEFLQPRYITAAPWVDDLLRAPRRASPSSVRPAKRSPLSRQLAQMLYKKSGPFRPWFAIAGSDRSIGAELSGELLRMARVAGGHFVPMDLNFHGSAGQSFGAFLIDGLRFHLSGEANDYVGKGLSGGIISIDAGTVASVRGDVLAGNTVLYGATSGELYVAGRAGERFAVRNSGALAVVEGVGDHGCEYMTGGVALVLGPTGINFGSGMTGGLSYVAGEYARQELLNREFVRMEECTAAEDEALRQVLIRHALLAGSPRAAFLLNAGARLPLVRVQPLELPCTIEQTWAPILERLSQPALDMRKKHPQAGRTIPIAPALDRGSGPDFDQQIPTC
ncbi:MAG: glutamate synthase-related protein, partial [Actinomycetota bacterium]